jgi:hypothetical protein
VAKVEPATESSAEPARALTTILFSNFIFIPLNFKKRNKRTIRQFLSAATRHTLAFVVESAI